MISETMHSTEVEGFSIDAVPNPAAAYTDYYDGEDGRDSLPSITTDKDLVVEEHSTDDVKSVIETNEEESTVALPSLQNADPKTVADEKDSDLEFSSSSDDSS